MLLDEIKESQELGERYTTSSVSEQRLKEYEHIYKKMKETGPIVSGLIQDQKNVSLISEQKIDEVDRLIKALLALKNELKSVTKTQINEYFSNLEYLGNEAKKKMELEWSNYRSENFSKNNNLITSLLNIIDSDERLDELGELKQKITSKGIGDAETKKQVERYKELTNEILHDLDMKDMVEDFLLKLSRGEDVTLADVDEVVMEWIIQHKIARKIKLSI